MRTRNVLRTTAVSAALALTGSGLAYAAATAPAPVAASTDGATDSARVASHGADGHKHGGQAGHLDGSSSGLRLVGQMRINQDVEGRVADVGVHKGFAYVAAFDERDCQKGGVYVFDVRDVTAPKQVNFIRTANNSYVGEGSQALSLRTPAFTGDLLIHNNEVCTGGGNAGGTDHSVGGINLVDVSNPKTHKQLAVGFGDRTGSATKAHAVHSAFAWQPSADKAYAVLVDNEESADIDIADITDPRNPRIIAEYDLDSGAAVVDGRPATGPKLPLDAVKGSSESFLHDMVVKSVGGKQVMLASYWDGGYVTLDVTDPRRATLIADSDFAAVDEQLLEQTGARREPEGNAHQAEFTRDGTMVLAADEDFSPYSLVSTYGSGTPFDANSGDGTTQLTPGTTLRGATVFVGRACPGDPTVPAATAAGQVAVVERGVCTFTEKVAAVSAANASSALDYAAVLIVNRTGSDACEATLGMSVSGALPTFGVTPRSLAYALFGATGYDAAACREEAAGATRLPIALGATGQPVTFDSYFDGWGYLRLFRNTTGKLQQLDTFAIPEAMDQTKAVGSGDLSVHEVAFSEKKNGLAYVSYYAGGTRVFDVSGGTIKQVAHHIDADGSNVWGVQVFQSGGKEYVAASDRDYGIQIFEYAPANAT